MSRVWIVLLLALLGLCHALQFCNMPQCEELPHIGCNNSLEFHESCLRFRVPVNMEIYKEYLTKMHNKYREEVAAGMIPGVSAAAHLPEMLWHSKLSLLAEYHVKRCLENLEHYCTALPDFPSPGVNYGYNQIDIRSMPDYHSRINSEKILLQTEQWMHQVYRLGDINATTSSKARSRSFSYTSDYYEVFEIFNVLNEQNSHLGCAAAEYFDREWSQFLLICYYDGQFNHIHPIYESGPFQPAQCPHGPSYSYPHLCKPQEDAEEE